MNVKTKQTNTTEASATLGHDDIVSILGLAVMMQADIARSQPGTTVTVSLVPVDGSDQFSAKVDIVVDHNYVAPPVAPAPVEKVTVKDEVPAATEAPPPAALSGLVIPTLPV